MEEAVDATAAASPLLSPSAPSVDVAQVRDLLESAARRHRRISEQIVEFGDDPSATQFPVKDARRCDFPLTPVSARPSTAAVLKQQQQRRRAGSFSLPAETAVSGSSAAAESDGSLPASGSATAVAADVSAWGNQLHLHVVHLLQKLRARPDELREFLLVHYEDESEENARRTLSVSLGESEDESGDEEEEDGAVASGIGGHSRRESVAARLARRERVLKKRMGKNYAKLRLVFGQLHRVAFVMGETLYQQVHAMVRRSVSHGVINRQANLVRLESIYKLELRRQVTTERLLETVKAKDAERKKKKRRQQRDEQHVRAQTLRRKTKLLVAAQNGGAGSSKAGDGAVASASSGQSQMRFALWDQQHTEMEPIKSAHFFKMHALERVLAHEWRGRQGSSLSHGVSFNTSANDLHLPHGRLVSEQTEELIHEKLTAFLYSKNRETFPVWREPPESSFTREETLRYLKRLLPMLMSMALFAGLTIDQLVEFVRVMKWRTSVQGQKAVQQEGIMDELVVVMDGKLDFLPPLTKKESKSDPKSPDTNSTAPDTSDASAVVEAGAPASVSEITSPQSTVVPTYFGELGMLSKSEVWKSTLFATSPAVKMLVLSRGAFDSVLLKLFGGSKSRQLLLVAQQQQQRPSSSPAASGARRHTSMSAMSPTRPFTAANAVARDKSIVALKQVQAAYVLQQHQRQEEERDRAPQPEQQQQPDTTSRVSEALGRGAPVPVVSRADESQGAARQDAVMKPRPKDGAEKPKQQYGASTIQHYPSFDTPVRGDGASGIAHSFRLKWAQPIAFQMESLDAAIFNEWAPSFPDTSAMVDFLSGSSLSSTCLLFEKKNVLLKENLRSVCFHHQFLGSAYTSSHTGRLTSPTESSGAEKSSHPLSHGATFAGASHGSSHAGGGQHQSEQHQENSGETGPMTLSQFSDARKKSSSNSAGIPRNSSRQQLSGSSSMHNLLPSPLTSSATALNLGHVPFSRSSFVSESSFYADRKGRNRRGSQLSSNREDDEDERSEGEDDDDELDLTEIAALQAQGGGDVPRKKSRPKSANHPQSDGDAAGDSQDAESGGGKTTRARKMALDSLMYSMSANSPRKSKLLDQDTAKEIIVKKYLQASSAHEAAATPRKSPKRSAMSALPFSPPVPAGNGIDSHAPLPLRVDLQRRMEAVLAALKMKPKTKLDLVLKYTHADHYDRFQMAVVLWEQALHYVTKREAALTSLWRFELVASDPRRHFRSLSTHRLTEQKERDALFYQLNFASDVCREALAELEKQCGDKVYFEDRLYADKMKKDYTELLFDVEQERLRMIYGGVRPSVSTADARSEQSGAAVQVAAENEKREQEEREAALEEQRQVEAQDERERRRRSSIGATHRMTMQVKLQRQAELSELTERLQTQKQQHGSVSASSSSRGDRGGTYDEVRRATATKVGKESSPAASDLALLQRALHHFIHRPKD